MLDRPCIMHIIHNADKDRGIKKIDHASHFFQGCVVKSLYIDFAAFHSDIKFKIDC